MLVCEHAGTCDERTYTRLVLQVVRATRQRLDLCTAMFVLPLLQHKVCKAWHTCIREG